MNQTIKTLDDGLKGLEECLLQGNTIENAINLTDDIQDVICFKKLDVDLATATQVSLQRPKHWLLNWSLEKACWSNGTVEWGSTVSGAAHHKSDWWGVQYRVEINKQHYWLRPLPEQALWYAQNGQDMYFVARDEDASKLKEKRTIEVDLIRIKRT